MTKLTQAERRDKQELNGYIIFTHLITERLSGHSLMIKQTDSLSSHDVRMTADTTAYAVELKWCENCKYDHFLLKTDKFNYMQQDIKDDEKERICYICSNGEYYIFDLDEFKRRPLSQIKTKLVPLKVTQFSENERVEKQWCYLLNKNEARLKGRWQQ